MATTSTIAAVIASKNRSTPSGYPRGPKPTPLVLPDEDEESVYQDTRSRRPSTSSVDSDSEDSPQSPGLSALDSSAALILVHDDSDDSHDRFDFSDDETGEDDDIVSPIFEIRRTSIPPLPPLSIFLYLLGPYLKLGAINLLASAESVPLKYTLPALFGFAISSAFSRQLWYMLARYMRKADIMELVCDTFAKSRGKERQRRIIRTTVKLNTALVNALLAIVYLHESANHILPLLQDSLVYQIAISSAFASLIVYLSAAQSLAFKRVVYASWLSILSYIVWFSCVIYAHAKGILPHEGGWFGHPPSSWQAIFAIGFAFTTTSTLPLYASLKSGGSPLATGKIPRHRSFRVLSLLSTSCATALVLPLVIFAALPNLPATTKPSPTPQSVRIALNFSSSVTLLLGVPQAILSVPPLPIRFGRTSAISRTVTSLLIISLAILLSFIRSSFIEHLFTPLNITLLVLTIASTYFLPALLHISVHFFKRPLSIVIPRTPLLQTSSTSSNVQSPRAAHDELLQRKERALQKKQFKKRIVWDIGAWLQVWLCAAGAVVGVSYLLR